MTTTNFPSTFGADDPRSGADQSASGGRQSFAGAFDAPEASSNAYQAAAGGYQPAGGTYQPGAGSYQPPAGPYQPPLPPVSYRAKRSTAAMIVGAIILVSGLLTAISGGVLLALFGSGNVLSSGGHPISTPTTALVTDLGTITDTNGFDYIAGTPTLNLTVDSFGGEPVFVGIAPSDDVAEYLSGAAVERITDLNLSPFQLDTVGRDGAQAVGAPGEQDFWVASAQSATGAEIDWALQEGHYQVVVMNADGTANVHTTASIGVSLPNSTGLWTLVIGIGVAFVVVGGIVMAVGASRPTNN